MKMIEISRRSPIEGSESSERNQLTSPHKYCSIVSITAHFKHYVGEEAKIYRFYVVIRVYAPELQITCR